MALSPIGKDVRSFSQRFGLTDQLSLLERAWEAEIGSLARLAKIIAIDGETLVVEVSSSAAMQELSLRRKELIRRLNKYFKEPFVKFIQTKVA